MRVLKYALIAFVVYIVCAKFLFAGEVPPEVNPRIPGPVKLPIEKDITDEPIFKDEAKCPTAKSDYKEGKIVCMCEPTTCKPKIVTKVVDRPVEKVVIKVVEKPVEKEVIKVVEKPVDAEIKHFRVAAYYGQGPEGLERIIYKKKDGTREYQVLQNQGDVGAIEANYRIDENWDVGGMYISNDTKLIGLGFSF